MSYWIKAVLGLALFLGGLAAFVYGIYHLMEIGTCASGGPYVSARECPAGTGKYAAMLPGGIISGLIGAALLAARGTPRPGASQRIGGWKIGILAWSALFIGTGAAALYSAFGPAAAGEGGKGTGIFLGALFIPMGAIPLLVTLFGSRGSKPAGLGPGVGLDALRVARAAYDAANVRVTPPFTTSPATPPSPAAAPADPVERLRRLGELRAQGVLSQAEFEAAKARILAEL